MAEPNTCLKHELGRVFDYDGFRLHLGLQMCGWRRLSVCFGLFAGIGSSELALESGNSRVDEQKSMNIL